MRAATPAKRASSQSAAASAPQIPRALQDKLLKVQEFRGCAFSSEPRLYSYKQQRHKEFAAMLLNPMNAPVLIVAGEIKTCRVLFKDYPSLRYIVVPRAAKPEDASLACVHTRETAFPLDTLFAGGQQTKREAQPANRADLWMLFAALAGAFAIVLFVLSLIV